MSRHFYRNFNDNINLIKEISKKRALWDTKHKESNNVVLKNILWEELAVTLDTSLNDIKKRWKYLKDTYRKELKKNYRSNSNGTMSDKPIKWAYFEKLGFLKRGVMDTLDISIEEFDSNDNNYDSDTAKEENTTEIYEISDYDPNTDNEYTENNGYNSSPSVQEVESKDNSYLNKSARPNTNSQCDDTILRNDADYNFLISFLPYMKKMTDLENLRFRTEMSKILMEIKEAEEETQKKSVPNKRRRLR